VLGPAEDAFVRLAKWAYPRNLMIPLIYVRHREMLGCTKAVAVGQEVEKRVGPFRKNTCLDHLDLVEVDIAAASEVKALLVFGGRVGS
jgi:hypothetical protein